ncbi:MAG: MBL fold metallo-hydrolase [Acidimicrobiia bacterium]|jgi:glyoxylase-like metal-dependent hydrolase (beta-lactamase superfamily II)
MIIERRSLWLAETNCYLVAAEAGGPGILIDAPPDLDGLAALLDAHGVVPVGLLLTHAHIDHGGGARAATARWAMRAYLHPDDEWLARDTRLQLATLFGPNVPPELADEFAPPEEFAALADGMVLDLAGISLEVLHTPGHTPGHCCFLHHDDGVLFAGDHLFAGSVGRTDLPGGDHAMLLRSMADKILPLPDETRVLPGHGPTTTLAQERRTNPFLQQV